ncbi:MAG: helicase C-terminal domain-containing protein [Caldilineaceae bacterium]
MAPRAFVALDLETTGLDANADAIIEIGAVRIEQERVTATFSTLVNPGRRIPLRVQQLTGIRDEDVAVAPSLAMVLPELRAFVGPDVVAVVAHNAAFDLGFLRAAGVNFQRPALDTFELAGILLPGQPSYSLGELCRALAITLDDAHRALDDALATAELFVTLRQLLFSVPGPVIQTLHTAGVDSNWPPMLLIDEAWDRLGRQTQAPARTDLSELALQPAPLPLVPETLIRDGGPPLTPVPEAELLDFFAADGPLAAQFDGAFEARPGQVEMARLVLAALNDGEQMLLEAGTGVGKSLAYLLPAALWSLRNQRRVVIATNTIALQDQLIDKDIPQVQAMLQGADGGELHAALLKGRGQYLCVRRLHAWYQGRALAPQELSVLAKVLVWLPATTTGDVSELFLPSSGERAVWSQICSDAATCHPGRCGGPNRRDFYLDARRRADHTHLLVINHALLTVDIGNEGRALPRFSHLIIDEAHHLEDVTTDAQTHMVDWRVLDAQLARLALDGALFGQVATLALHHRDGPVQELLAQTAGSARRAQRALRHFAEQLHNFAVNHTDLRTDAGYAQRLALDGRMRSQPMWSQLEIEWEQSDAALGATVRRLTELTAHLAATGWREEALEGALLAELEGLAESLGELHGHTCAIINGPARGEQVRQVAWLEYTPNAGQESQTLLAAAPLYVGDVIGGTLVQRLRTCVLTGATLRSGADFRYIRERLGLWDAHADALPSPFDYRTSTLIYMPDDLPQPNHPSYQRAVDAAIIAAATAAGGRTMVLFTSYAHLRATAEGIRAPLDRQGITVLQHGSSSRRRLLREYRATERAVLLGTRSFWEGIDLPGEQLSVLVIVKLPFAVPSDPLVAARSAEFENSFMEYTLPDAILRFRQGFGRLIRRASDRGVVLLLDSRIWQKRYGQAFLEALPACTVRRASMANLGEEVDLWLNKE